MLVNSIHGEPMNERETLLAQALHDVLVKADIINAAIPCDPPTLLMATETYLEPSNEG